MAMGGMVLSSPSNTPNWVPVALTCWCQCDVAAIWYVTDLVICPEREQLVSEPISDFLVVLIRTQTSHAAR